MRLRYQILKTRIPGFPGSTSIQLIALLFLLSPVNPLGRVKFASKNRCSHSAINDVSRKKNLRAPLFQSKLFPLFLLLFFAKVESGAARSTLALSMRTTIHPDSNGIGTLFIILLLLLLLLLLFSLPFFFFFLLFLIFTKYYGHANERTTQRGNVLCVSRNSAGSHETTRRGTPRPRRMHTSRRRRGDSGRTSLSTILKTAIRAYSFLFVSHLLSSPPLPFVTLSSSSPSPSVYVEKRRCTLRSIVVIVAASLRRAARLRLRRRWCRSSLSRYILYRHSSLPSLPSLVEIVENGSSRYLCVNGGRRHGGWKKREPNP